MERPAFHREGIPLAPNSGRRKNRTLTLMSIQKNP
jgi:hypothetical protein